MVSSKVSQQKLYDMGQTSSQLGPQSLEDPAMKDTRKSQGDKPKSKKSKRKSAEMEETIGAEEDTARVLLQMSGAHSRDSRTRFYNEHDSQASAQLISESSPAHALNRPNISDMTMEPSRKIKHREKTITKKAAKNDNGVPSNEEAPRRGHPSTPPRQRDRSTTPASRPSLTQTTMAIDEIHTSDEEAASILEEYQKENDINGFSQQLPDAPGLSYPESPIYSSYQLPVLNHVSPLPQEKPKKKRKRNRGSTLENAGRSESTWQDTEGQYTFNVGSKAFDSSCIDRGYSANMFGNLQVDNMPIDPELHSMNAFPPSADLSTLGGEEDDLAQQSLQKVKRKNNSTYPRKRQRIEELQHTGNEEVPYHSPYIELNEYGRDPQDHVLPGFEDSQHRMSVELGSPFVGDSDRNHRGSDNRPGHVESTRKPNISIKGKSQQDKKKKHGEQKANVTGRPLKEVSEKGGVFSAAELAKLEAFRESYCEANNMSLWQYNSLIHSNIRGNPQAAAIYNEIHDLVPYRPRSSVQRFCRRRFHNFSARGIWTAEEDEMLKDAVAQKGKSWKAVGELIDRFPEDCRDRYRNYLDRAAENRNKEAWTEAEVLNLCRAILDCLQMMREERRRTREENIGRGAPVSETDSDREAEEMKLINWQIISDRMASFGSSRSRLQCNFKWNKIKGNDRNRYLKEIKLAREGLRRLQDGDYTANNATNSTGWRMRQASKKVINMKPGDRYDFLKAILDSAAPTEGNIPWRLLGDEVFRNKWSTTERKAAWTMMKAEIPGSDAMDYREIVHRHLTSIVELGDEERWDPDIHGWAEETKAKRSKPSNMGERKGQKETKREKKAKARALEKERRQGIKSNEFIHDSDEDEAVVGALPRDVSFNMALNGQSGHNRFDLLRTPGTKNDRPTSDREGSITTDEQEEPAKNILQENDNSRDSLFGSDGEEQDMADGDISADLAGRVRSLRHIAAMDGNES